MITTLLYFVNDDAKFFQTQTKSAIADGPKPVCDNCDLCTENVLFFMFPDARFQSKTNEKLICRLDHLSIDVVKLQLRLVWLEYKNPSSTGVHVQQTFIAFKMLPNFGCEKVFLTRTSKTGVGRLRASLGKAGFGCKSVNFFPIPISFPASETPKQQLQHAGIL